MKFKNDKYRKARGGFSRFLEIKCGSCESFICYYQKDGPGILKRTYVDRMIVFEKSDDKLTCKNCKALLGNYFIYDKENRPAFAIIPGAISKKIVKISELR